MTLVACAPESGRTEAPAAIEVSRQTSPATPVLAHEPTSAASPIDDDSDAVANDDRWHPTLRAIAGGYKNWGRVDDQMRWAPTLCAMPQPARARISASGHESTHGRKLYTLYAKDPEAYGAHKSFVPAPEVAGLADIAQVLVKEAFVPVETARPDNSVSLDGELSPAQHEGKTYVPGEPLGIYVVFKPRQTRIDTDAGWVYGTVSADLKTVTSSGKVASCMGCHQKAPNDRLFGLAEKQVYPQGPGPDGRHTSPK